MLERRRRAARTKRERARREQAAIRREKAAARRGRGAPDRRVREEPSASRRRSRGSGAGRARSQPRPAARRAAAGITAFGERASKLLLAAAAPLAAGVAGLTRLARRGLAWLSAVVTPLRATIAVTGIAAVLLAVSQFVDYRGVAVGVQDYAAYADVEPVASAPHVDRREAGEPHAYLLVPLAALALVLLVACARGRWQLGRVVSLLGLAALAVAILVDVPAGLDEGEQAITYASVEAELLEGFWVEIVSAAVLVIGGLLVAHYGRPAQQRARPGRRGPAVRRLGARPA